MTRKKMNVLFVGCHPDDIELGCGGTIAKHLELGDSVFGLIMTNGEQGNHTPNMEECRNSMRVLGIQNVYFGNFKDGFLSDNRDVVAFIENLVKSLNITRVYTHHYNDRHQDHRHCSLAVSAGARKVPEIFLYEGPSTLSNFDPHYFIGLSKHHVDKKIAALDCYKTQIAKGIVNLRWIKSLAVVRGASCNTDYAEAFDLNHIFMGESGL